MPPTFSSASSSGWPACTSSAGVANCIELSTRIVNCLPTDTGGCVAAGLLHAVASSSPPRIKPNRIIGSVAPRTAWAEIVAAHGEHGRGSAAAVQRRHHDLVVLLRRRATLHRLVIERVGMRSAVVASDRQRRGTDGADGAWHYVDADWPVVVVRELHLHAAEVGEPLIRGHIGQPGELRWNRGPIPAAVVP